MLFHSLKETTLPSLNNPEWTEYPILLKETLVWIPRKKGHHAITWIADFVLDERVVLLDRQQPWNVSVWQFQWKMGGWEDLEPNTVPWAFSSQCHRSLAQAVSRCCWQYHLHIIQRIQDCINFQTGILHENEEWNTMKKSKERIKRNKEWGGGEWCSILDSINQSTTLQFLT